MCCVNNLLQFKLAPNFGTQILSNSSILDVPSWNIQFIATSFEGASLKNGDHWSLTSLSKVTFEIQNSKSLNEPGFADSYFHGIENLPRFP